MTPVPRLVINTYVDNEQKIWREAFVRLKEIERLWDDERRRSNRIQSCREWMDQQECLPRLAGLSRLMEQQMDRRQLWSALVPVERAVTRLRVTDVDILDADLSGNVRQGELMPVKVVVDSMRSAFNVGGIFRSSECFGVEEVILCGYSAVPQNPQVAKAALGACELVKWRYVEKIREAVAGLVADGVTCYALETVEGAPTVGQVNWNFPCALVLGNERFGLDPDVVQLCNGGAVRIQLFGAKNSLNVVSAFSVAAYQVRQRSENDKL